MAAAETPAVFASLLELNGQLRSGAVRARDLARRTLQALEAEARPGGAVRELLEDDALRMARDVERELKRGRTRGLLQGAPFGMSELLQRAGRAPAWNREAEARQVEDAAAVSRLRGAKALPAAVLASPSLGGVASGFAAEESACASVVARGLLPFAISVDFNGNVLRAAARHGSCALRPTFGTVSGFGAAPLAWTLAAVSVVARTPDDCGHVLAAISGSDSRCHHSPGRSFRYAPQHARAPQELRVILASAPEAAVAAFSRAGAELVRKEAPREPYSEVVEVIVAAECGEVFEAEMEADAGIAGFLNDARSLTAFDYLRAARLRRQAQEWYSLAFADADAVVFGAAAGGGAEDAAWLPLALLAGAPVLAVSRRGGAFAPCFVAGRPQTENTLIRLAAAVAGEF